MKQSVISDEQLNALLDGELDQYEREKLLQEIAVSPELKSRYDELQKLKSLLRVSYQQVPQPVYSNSTVAYRYFNYRNLLQSAVILCFGVLIGWYAAGDKMTANPNIQAIEKVSPQLYNRERILIHISSNEERRVKQALNVAEKLLKDNSHGRALTVEVVANAEGLAVLRKNSPYAKKIAELSNAHDNIKFLACGIAKKVAALKENKPIELLPQARDIPAALDEILRRLQEGWTYVRG